MEWQGISNVPKGVWVKVIQKFCVNGKTHNQPKDAEKFERPLKGHGNRELVCQVLEEYANKKKLIIRDEHREIIVDINKGDAVYEQAKFIPAEV